MLNRPPRIVKFGVWVKYEDGTDVMIVNDRPFNFDYEIDAPAMLVGIDDGFTRYQPSPNQHIKAEFDCKESMYVTDGVSFLEMMDPDNPFGRIPKIRLGDVIEFEGRQIRILSHYVDVDRFRYEPRFAGRYVGDV